VECRILVAAGLSFLPTGSFVLDPATSQVEFLRARQSRGLPESPATSRRRSPCRNERARCGRCRARIDARSITTGSGLRDAQMHRDFLMSDQYPVMTFQGTAVPTGSLRPSPSCARDRQLTIKGTTHDVEFPVAVIALQDIYMVDGKFHTAHDRLRNSDSTVLHLCRL